MQNRKKGFTLVELLVVIAILAILATVSVVGYTSFIDRANKSVDRQTVEQLNNLVAAGALTESDFTLAEAEALIEANGFELPYECSYKNYKLGYVAAAKTVVLVENGAIVYPEGVTGTFAELTGSTTPPTPDEGNEGGEDVSPEQPGEGGGEVVTPEQPGEGGEPAESTNPVTLDFTAQGYEDQHAVTSLELGGVTVTFDKGTGTAPKYYDNGSAVRVYPNNTITISANPKNISKIEFAFGSEDGSNEITSDVGTYADGTWTSVANPVTFTVGGSSGHRRITSITVTLTDDPVVAVHTCESKCDTCGKCTDTTCEDEKCADKCAGHATITAALVTDASALAAGDKIIIVAEDSEEVYAISTTQKTNNRGQAVVTKTGSNVAFVSGGDVQILTLALGTKENTFAFNAGNGYLHAASSSSNHLRTEETLSDNSSFTIEIDASGVATVIAQGENTRNILKYNKSSDIFSCYASGQQDVSIYKIAE